MAEGFARLLKRYRVEAGLSQENLAELSGVSTDAISALERGLRRAPYKSTLDLLIAALALDDSKRLEIEEAATLARVRGARGQRDHVLSDLPEASLNNLPLRLTSFVDRESVVAEIKEKVLLYRLVTIVGPGGAGKTRCAIETAASMLDAFVDGVWLVEFSAISDPSLVTSVVARTLRIRETPSRTMLDSVLAHLNHKRLLLIFDNCEHVIDEARDVVAAILHACADVRILATSRESLRIAGEQSYRIPSLPVPSTSESLSAEEMSKYGAVRLFSDRAISADNRFTLSVESAPLVANICRRLDGMPLAIELAAARVKTLSPKQLAEKLDDRLRLLKAGDHSALPRHRTMRALIDWSYDLLSSDERRFFRKLSIFSGGFTLELAAAVCGDPEADDDDVGFLDVLSSLVEKSLVQTEPAMNAQRYRLLESTREYAREKLIAAGEEHAVARDHARAFLALAEQLDDDWETSPDREWLAEADAQLENFVAALYWALGAQNDVLLGVRLVAALNLVWRYYPVEGRRWVQIAQQQDEADIPAAVLAALDLEQAMVASMLGQYKVSLRSAERALSRYFELGDPKGISEAKRRIGHTQIFLGNVSEGETLLREGLETLRALGARRSVVVTLQSLALARRFAGDIPGARQLFGEALEAARAIGAERPAATIAINLAETEFRAGDAAAALGFADEALALARDAGDVRHVANTLYNKAAYLVALQRYDDARIVAREALSAAHGMQWSVGVAFTLQHLAAIAAFRKNVEDRDRAARILGYVDGRLVSLEALREYTEQQEYDAAIPELRDALGNNKLDELMAEGSAWNEAQAVAEAMLV